MKKLATRTAQSDLVAEFVFNFNDWVVDSVSGSKLTFGSTAITSVDPTEPGLIAGTGVTFDCVPMPAGAVIVGGSVIVETAFVGIGAGATLNVGVAGNITAYMAALDLDAATAGSRTALSLATPLASNNGQNIRLTTAGIVATATAGRVRIRVVYSVDGRATEAIGN